MQITVLFFGSVKDIVGRSKETIVLEEGSNIGRLFDICAARFPRLTEHASSILFSRNREFTSRSECLQEGDEVAFLPPVSGGAPGETENFGERVEEKNIYRLTRDPIDTRALIEKLRRGEDGAVVVFEGVVRNHSGNRATLFLEYEAYEPMALEKMRAIIAEVQQKFPVDRVGIVHRLGRLQIGEASVVIVVTSAHRHPAFEACHYAIDRLKRIVPIWKKEFFADGAVWVEREESSCAVSSS